MAAQYFLYTTLYSNTLVDRSDTTFVPLPPDTGQILIDYFIPTIQPLYYYKESGGTSIVENDQATIDAYLQGTALPQQPQDSVVQYQFTGYTATTAQNFNSFTGTTLPANYYNKTQINSYSASTLTNINSKIPKVLSGVTDGHLALMNADGTIRDGGLSIAQLTGGTGYYVYGENETAGSTASVTPVSYLTTGATLVAGTFSLDYIAVLGNSVKIKPAYVQFYMDGAALSAAYAYSPPENNGVFPIAFMKDLQITAGPHTFSVRYYAGVNTALMSRAAIRVRKVQ